MNIRIQIEQLILEEMNLTPGQRSRVQTAMEAELSRLVSAEGLPSGFQGGGFISKLPVDLNAAMSTQLESLGISIAQFVYAQLHK